MDPLAHIPGAGAPPLVGHSLRFLRDCHGLIDSRRARYGDVFRTELLGRTVVVFLTPQATREIYLDTDQVLSSEGGWSTSIGPLFRRGLMLRDFPQRPRRKRGQSPGCSIASMKMSTSASSPPTSQTTSSSLSSSCHGITPSTL